MSILGSRYIWVILLLSVAQLLCLWSRLNEASGIVPPKRKRPTELEEELEEQSRGRTTQVDYNAKSQILGDSKSAENVIFQFSVPSSGGLEDSFNILPPESNRFKSAADCPRCPNTAQSLGQSAIEELWKDNILAAYGCACQQLQKSPEDGFSQAIVYSLTQSKSATISVQGKINAPSSNPPSLKRWDILGPLPVGKLEVDGDPTFITTGQDSVDGNRIGKQLDPALHVLTMRASHAVLSEHAVSGRVKWSKAVANENGEVST